ncbi:MAG: FAD binding domain-containing protein, partial [Phycisphaerales bacterium]|nr:FAD binding domain-containing protein [Phycisphaerales bacterium]
HAEAARAFPLLVEAGRQVGAIQIQTRGTWAGNIGNGSPAADGVPVLMAYDARVVLASATGRREVALDAYFTGYRESVRRPDELIVAIRLPRRARTVEWFHKVGARQAQAITKVGVAVVQDDVGWRIVANSVAPTVVRCAQLEAALERGESFDSADRVEEVLKHDISPIDDIRSTKAYRSRVLAQLLFHFLYQDVGVG